MGDRGRSEPTTDHEWTVHALNIHGVMFERWCEKQIESAPGWHVAATQYPVAYPPAGGSRLPRESVLDIRAETLLPSPLTLVVECKKANPDSVNWQLFLREENRNRTLALPAVSWAPLNDSSGRRHVGDVHVRELWTTIKVAEQARETRGTYAASKKADKTKTSNAAVQDAAYQVALATQSIVAEEARRAAIDDKAERPPCPPYRVFLPVIVTTAALFGCTFDPIAVAAETGEIPFTEVQFEPLTSAFLRFPLPGHLQPSPRSAAAIDSRNLPFLRYLPVLVVTATALKQVLGQLVGIDRDALVSLERRTVPLRIYEVEKG